MSTTEGTHRVVPPGIERNSPFFTCPRLLCQCVCASRMPSATRVFVFSFFPAATLAPNARTQSKIPKSNAGFYTGLCSSSPSIHRHNLSIVTKFDDEGVFRTNFFYPWSQFIHGHTHPRSPYLSEQTSSIHGHLFPLF
jgi:hypothetical protein